MPNTQPTVRTIALPAPRGGKRYATLWVPPHGNRRAGSYVVPTRGAHSPRYSPPQRQGR